MTICLSPRLDRVKPSITLAVTALAADLRSRGVDIVSFAAGEPDFDTPEHIKQAARDALDKGVSKYTNVRGTPALREAVAVELGRAHGIDLQLDQVLVSCGAKHSLFNVFLAMLDDGDEVVIPAPYWVSYPDMVRIAGGNPVIVQTTSDDGFMMSPNAFESAITDRTRAVVINTPGNPSGAVYSRERLEALGEIATRRGVYIISDDIYRSLVYGDASYTSIASLSKEIADYTILVDGVSKAYAMTGWRIGYTAGPKPLIDGMAKIQGQSTSGASHISQVAATAALTGSQDCIAQMRTAFDARRKVMVERLRAIPEVTCREPQGAFYAFPDMSAHIGKQTPDGVVLEDDVALCKHLVEAGSVAIVPGSGFGAPGHTRLSYACSMEDIERGISRISETIAGLK